MNKWVKNFDKINPEWGSFGFCLQFQDKKDYKCLMIEGDNTCNPYKANKCHSLLKAMNIKYKNQKPKNEVYMDSISLTNLGL